MNKDEYNSKRKRIKVMGVPLTLFLAGMSLKGCHDAVDLSGNPYRNEPVIQKFEDTRNLYSAFTSLDRAILSDESNPQFQTGVLKNIRDFKSREGLVEQSPLRQELTSYLEGVKSEVARVRKKLNKDMEILANDPIYKNNSSYVADNLGEGILTFLGMGMLAFIAGRLTSNALDRNKSKYYNTFLK